MAVAIVIFVVCFAGGAFASSRWLPDLETGAFGGFAFFATCGLVGAGLAVVGLHIDSIVNTLNGLGGDEHTSSLRGEVVANGLADLLWQAGLLFALAAAVYLLAPRIEGVAEDPAETST